MINSQPTGAQTPCAPSISKGMGDQFSAAWLQAHVAWAVYQRGWVINSQREGVASHFEDSISKGMGDQFSATTLATVAAAQYIKGDG